MRRSGHLIFGTLFRKLKIVRKLGVRFLCNSCDAPLPLPVKEERFISWHWNSNDYLPMILNLPNENFVKLDPFNILIGTTANHERQLITLKSLKNNPNVRSCINRNYWSIRTDR